MSRINSSIGALYAQKNVSRANKSLAGTLEQMSTGKRINRGSDDPAGLIAANYLDSDIKAINQAIRNSERASLAIQTADSYLSQVQSRMTDMRRLAVEAANGVAMSPAQIRANQLVMDSSVDAIDRIAKTANFQGNKFFDGSMDYQIDTDASGNLGNLTDINIQSASGLGGDVVISVTQAATQASLSMNASAASSASGGSEAFTMENAPVETTTVVTEWTGTGGDLAITSTGELASGDTFTVDGTTPVGADTGTAAITGISNISDSGEITFEGTYDSGGAATVSVDADTLATMINDYGTANGVDISAASVSGDIDFDISAAGQVTLNAAVTPTSTETSEVTGGATAQVSIGDQARFEHTEFWTPSDPVGTGGNTAEFLGQEQYAVVNRADGQELTVSLQIGSGNPEGVTQNADGSYVITMDASRVGDNVQETAEGIQAVITADGTYAEEIYSTYENRSGNDLVSYTNPDGGTGQVVTAGSTTRVSDSGYLMLQGIGGGEAANNLNVAVQFGPDDSVGFDTVNNVLRVTISTQPPDWQQLTASLRGLGNIGGIDFSQASFGGGLSSNKDNLGLTAQENFPMEGSTGATGGYTLRGEATLELRGDFGTETLSFGQGATREEVVAGINDVTGSTGVTARVDGEQIIFESQQYGSNSEVNVTMVSDAGHFDINLGGHHAAGSDAVATVNGQAAVTDGNNVRVSNSTLQGEFRVEPGTAETVRLHIRPGGGAQFQLGPEVMGSQQANISFGNLSSGSLGNSEVGYLYQLKTGGSADLWSGGGQAAAIIGEASAYVDALSGRLGAFQDATLGTNIETLTDAMVNEMESLSIYADLDYAEASSRMARDSALQQAGLAVAAIANHSLSNVMRII